MLKTLIPLALMCLQNALLHSDDWTTLPTPVPNADTSISDINSSYDNQNNQFLVTWQDNSSGFPTYALYQPANGNWVPMAGPAFIPGAGLTNSNVCSCYGSAENQFLITWQDNSGDPYYIFYNPSTNTWTPSSPTSITTLETSNSDVFCSYDSVNNLFLATWFDDAYYAVYNPSTSTWTASSLPYSGSEPANNVYASFGSAEAQFLITYADQSNSNAPTYALYNALSDTWTPPSTPNVIPGGSSSNSDVFVSYDSQDDLFLVTWPDSSNLPTFAIYYPASDTWISSSNIPNALAAAFEGNIFSSYDNLNNQFLVTWADSSGSTVYSIYFPVSNTWSMPGPIPSSTFANSNIFSSFDAADDQFLVTWEDIGRPGFIPIYAVLSFSPSPISDLSGKQKVNDFGIVSERYNVLKWVGSTSAGIIGYNIYRNGVLLAQVGADVFTYQDHNRKKGESTTYGVEAVNADGLTSTPVMITLK